MHCFNLGHFPCSVCSINVQISVHASWGCFVRNAVTCDGCLDVLVRVVTFLAFSLPVKSLDTPTLFYSLFLPFVFIFSITKVIKPIDVRYLVHRNVKPASYNLVSSSVRFLKQLHKLHPTIQIL